MIMHRLLLPSKRITCFWLRMIIFSFVSPHGFWQCTSLPILFFSFFCTSNVFLFPPSITLYGCQEDTHAVWSLRRCQWQAVHQVCVCVFDLCVIIKVSSCSAPLLQYRGAKICGVIKETIYKSCLWIACARTLSIIQRAFCCSLTYQDQIGKLKYSGNNAALPTTSLYKHT